MSTIFIYNTIYNICYILELLEFMCIRLGFKPYIGRLLRGYRKSEKWQNLYNHLAPRIL